VPGVPESILLHQLLAKCLEHTSGYQFVFQVRNHSTRIHGAVFPELFKLGFSAGKSRLLLFITLEFTFGLLCCVNSKMV